MVSESLQDMREDVLESSHSSPRQTFLLLSSVTSSMTVTLYKLGTFYLNRSHTRYQQGPQAESHVDTHIIELLWKSFSAAVPSLIAQFSISV